MRRELTTTELTELCRRQLRMVKRRNAINKSIDENAKVLSSREEYMEEMMRVITEDQRERGR